HVADQSFLEGRSDILSFVTEPLETTLKAEGHLKACLNITSSTSDADIVVKLIDLRPDGCQLLIRSGVMPLRYRKSLSVPEPMVPGKAVDIEFILNDIAHHFLRGHRIMIQIQSSLFPLVAMNPQTFLPNQYEARPEDYKKAEIALNCGPRSYIALSVVD
ncbi:MAG: CocE/NonD family hydrolase, partial [Bacteroidales bacterium]|nr:CocE/NonD family hydrolase [Bacteroidales bacterium]